MHKQEVVIREAEQADIIQLVNMASEYIKESERWKSIPFNPTRSVMNALIALDDPNQKIVVAFKGCMLVGFMWSFISCTIWSDVTICQDRFLYVHPDHRDYKISSGLLDFIVEWAKDKGANAIHVGANSGIKEDKPAIWFYRSHGFKPIGINLYKEIL